MPGPGKALQSSSVLIHKQCQGFGTAPEARAAVWLGRGASPGV